MKKIIVILFSVLFLTSAYADMSDSDKNRAWECSGMIIWLTIVVAMIW